MNKLTKSKTMFHLFQIFNKPKQLLLVLLCFFSLLSFQLFSQQHFFINYNTSEKLVQSQVFAIEQNVNNELLLGTLGGISVFDGNNFTNITKHNGLPNNFITFLFKDNKNNIWIATNSGVCIHNGKNITPIYLKDGSQLNIITQIVEDKQHNIWALAAEQLYRFNGNHFEEYFITDEKILSIATDSSGTIWCSTYNGSIFSIQNNTIANTIKVDNKFPIISITKSNASNELLFLSLNSISKLSKDTSKLIPLQITLPKIKSTQTFLQDTKGNLWLSAQDGGILLYENGIWYQYNHSNGFTSDAVARIYEDHENNIWLGTNGSGVYRYTASPFAFYDKNTSLNSAVIMGIAEANNHTLYFSSINKGLYQLKNNQPEMIANNLPQQVNSIVPYFDNTLLCASFGMGLWTWNGKTLKPISDSNKMNKGYTNLYATDTLIWITTFDGLYSLNKDETITKRINKANVLCALPLNEDSVLIGSTDGAYMCSIKKGEIIKEPIVADVIVLSIIQNDAFVIIATDDRGIILWDKKTKKTKSISTLNGLSCDYIYSLLLDRNNNLWAGTGCGIDKIICNDTVISVINYGIFTNLTDAESNANACYEDKKGNIWIANTKGLFQFDATLQNDKINSPKIIIQSIKLFTQDFSPKTNDSLIPFSNVVWQPIFTPGQNHLTFTFKAISLSGSKYIRYRYILEGADIVATETELSTVVYSNLAPGDYVFKVSSTDKFGKWQNNEIQYPFTIQSKFYQTNTFKVSMILLIIGFGLTIMYLRNKQKENRRNWEVKLREEEQAKVKQKTAEDFHDEIGNKLTRIHLLASVAASKSAPYHNEDLNNILAQIKNSATSLYKGSKDIIWSLQPFSDELLETINRIHQNAEEMLENTGITLHYNIHYDEAYPVQKMVLPIDYSRNIIMIFKEAINNSIKHSGANNIYLTITVIRDKELIIEVRDDGKGFATAGDRGNGIGNMKSRADRINAALKMINKPDGVAIILEVMLR